SAFRQNGQWAEYVKGIDTDDFPVECVSWNDAVEFCKKLSELPEEKKAGRVYRLPTEAEGEYACRAGSRTPFEFGSELKPTLANYGKNVTRTERVGKYKPNAWGPYDMHGNVAEWCHDWYAERYYKDGPSQDRDPKGPEEAERILRGGSYYWEGLPYCRSAY